MYNQLPVLLQPTPPMMMIYQLVYKNPHHYKEVFNKGLPKLKNKAINLEQLNNYQRDHRDHKGKVKIKLKLKFDHRAKMKMYGVSKMFKMKEPRVIKEPELPMMMR
tara:strand:+ start:67 stop:384 length:318 start_codon:yes stop_codon:yes gene_type:complete